MEPPLLSSEQYANLNRFVTIELDDGYGVTMKLYKFHQVKGIVAHFHSAFKQGNVLTIHDVSTELFFAILDAQNNKPIDLDTYGWELLDFADKYGDEKLLCKIRDYFLNNTRELSENDVKQIAIEEKGQKLAASLSELNLFRQLLLKKALEEKDENKIKELLISFVNRQVLHSILEAPQFGEYEDIMYEIIQDAYWEDKITPHAMLCFTGTVYEKNKEKEIKITDVRIELIGTFFWLFLRKDFIKANAEIKCLCLILRQIFTELWALRADNLKTGYYQKNDSMSFSLASLLSPADLNIYPDPKELSTQELFIQAVKDGNDLAIYEKILRMERVEKNINLKIFVKVVAAFAKFHRAYYYVEKYVVQSSDHCLILRVIEYLYQNSGDKETLLHILTQIDKDTKQKVKNEIKYNIKYFLALLYLEDFDKFTSYYSMFFNSNHVYEQKMSCMLDIFNFCIRHHWLRALNCLSRLQSHINTVKQMGEFKFTPLIDTLIEKKLYRSAMNLSCRILSSHMGSKYIAKIISHS